MSTPNSDSDSPRYEIRGDVTTYAYDAKDQLVSEPDPNRERQPVLPKLEVVYDHPRHVIQITEPGSKTAEFEDGPVRYLMMERDPKTRALKPVIERGKPVYYYLAREK
jgi:hypothetical protein